MENDYTPYLIVIFGGLILIAILAIGWKTSPVSGVGYPSQGKLSSVVVSATGSASGEPSQALLYVTINGTGTSTQAATANLSGSSNYFNSTISKYINGNLSMVSTSYYNIEKVCSGSGTNYTTTILPVIPYYNYGCTSSQVKYAATEQLTVTIPNVQNVSTVLGSLSGAPNIYVTGTSSMLSSAQASSLRAQALSVAIANATAQAQAIMGPGSTVQSTNITVSSYNVYPYGLEASGSAGGVAPTAPTPQYYAGTSQVTESIYVVFYYTKG
jgi:uncharacterized protein YggE